MAYYRRYTVSSRLKTSQLQNMRPVIISEEQIGILHLPLLYVNFTTIYNFVVLKKNNMSSAEVTPTVCNSAESNTRKTRYTLVLLRGVPLNVHRCTTAVTHAGILRVSFSLSDNEVCCQNN